MAKDDADLFLDTLQSMEKRLVIPPTVAAEVRALGLQKIEEAVNTETAMARHTGRFLDKPQGAGAQHHDEYLKALLALNENFRHNVRADVESRYSRILGLLGRCTGPELPDETRRQILTEAPNRYLRRQPPGYTDAGKAPRGDVAYNDVLVFFEMIHLAQLRSGDVAFVTNEAKEDWWEIDQIAKPRRLLGGRYALSREFHEQSSRKFAIFHGERLIRDLVGLHNLAAQMPEALRQFEREMRKFSRRGLDLMREQLQMPPGVTMDLVNSLAIGNMHREIKEFNALLKSNRRGIFEFDNLLGVTALRGFAMPKHLDITRMLMPKADSFSLPSLAQSFGINKTLDLVGGVGQRPWDLVRGLGIQLPDSTRILRDMTFNVSQFSAPYLKQMQELIESARNMPRVDPAVAKLDALSRVKLPERDRDVGPMRRVYSRRRRALRRTLRGRRINLLNQNLPLRRVLIRSKQS